MLGLAEISITAAQKTGIMKFLEDFDTDSLVAGDTVDTIAEKLKTELQSLTIPITRPMGCHVVGFMDEGLSRKPKLRHVFHEEWNDAGEFTNEDSHSEYYPHMVTKLS